MELDQIGVAPDARRMGVGRALVGQVVDHARAVGAGRVELAVHAFNADARAFFAAAGFADAIVRMRLDVDR